MLLGESRHAAVNEGLQACPVGSGLIDSVMALQATVQDLQVKFHQAKPKFYPSRQRFCLPLNAGEKKATSIADGKKLSDYDIKDGSVLIFKDLGPQVSLSWFSQCQQCPRPVMQAELNETIGEFVLKCHAVYRRSATQPCFSGNTLVLWSYMPSSTSSLQCSTPPSSEPFSLLVLCSSLIACAWRSIYK